MNPRDVVVICASFGGVSALARLAQRWPTQLEVSILVAFDGGLQPASTVLQILQSYAPFAMRYAREGDEIKRGRIYLAPPDHHMLVAAPGVITLDPGSPFDNTRPSGDRLFTSAAEVFGPRVIGVVLTGSTNDGAQGLQRIEEGGGLGIVQDPSDATDPTMPSAALRENHPDYCVRIDAMVPLIERLVAGETPARDGDGPDA